MTSQKTLQTLLFLGTALLFAGCSTHYGAAKIDSVPPGAEIINLKDDAHLGATPSKVLFTSKERAPKQVTIQLVKPGYKSRITSFNINHLHDSAQAAAAAAIDVKLELEKE